jgi:hypothetical protein
MAIEVIFDDEIDRSPTDIVLLKVCGQNLASMQCGPYRLLLLFRTADVVRGEDYTMPDSLGSTGRRRGDPISGRGGFGSTPKFGALVGSFGAMGI